MLNVIFATKKKMSQAWTEQGKRLAVTRLQVSPNLVVGEKNVQVKTDASKANSLKDCRIVEIGYGEKKMTSMSKAMKTRIEKAGAKTGLRKFAGVRDFNQDESVKVGTFINLSDVLQPGDVVQVQGTTKGKGFAGAMKRWGFHGGPRTHGQSDRSRATGSIGQGTDPGRVFPGKKMPGHYGNVTDTVTGLKVLYVAGEELWVSGPVPGSINGLVRVQKVSSGPEIKLNKKASGIVEEEVKVEKTEEIVAEATVEAAQEKVEAAETKVEEVAEETTTPTDSDNKEDKKA
jgi:large subunit ribosomal protein L3